MTGGPACCQSHKNHAWLKLGLAFGLAVRFHEPNDAPRQHDLLAAPGGPVQSLWSGRFYCTTHSASGVIRLLCGATYSEAPIVATAPQLAHMTVLGTGPVR